MANQPLSQLPEATRVENDDILYSVVDDVSKKVTKGTLFDGVTFGEEVTTVEAEAISPYLHESNIVDGLNSTSTTDVLSANQGRVLNSGLSEVASGLSGEVTRATNAETSLRQAIDAMVSPSGQSVVVDSSLSISGAAADAKITGDNISDLNNQLTNIVSVGSFSIDGYYLYTDGTPTANADYHITDYVEILHGCKVQIFNAFAGSSSLAIAFYDESQLFISGINSVDGNYTVDADDIPSRAKYVRFGSIKTYLGVTYTPTAYVIESDGVVGLINGLADSLASIEPKNTTFFDGLNYFDISKAVVYTDRFINTSGYINSSSNVNTIVFPVKPNTTYYINIPNANRNVTVESANADFSVGTGKTILIGRQEVYPITFITGATAKYVGIYFNSGTYDYEANKNNIYLNKGQYYGNIVPFVGRKYLPNDIGTPLSETQVLIFGDSITDCCSISVNTSSETTSYSWRNPSNSYVDDDSQTIEFSMWPKILKDSQPCGEIRNYAKSGASYKTQTRESGYERQNLQYQIDVALNDLDNPNNVFEVDDFVPDIVIFALGTNDGAPNDTYQDAMDATVLDGNAIDVDATISALDDTKTISSARKAYMRIKKAFPMAQIYIVLPIQRADNNTNLGDLHTYLEKMAQRYSCIIIDGAFTSGITRDGNTMNQLGEYLKDGLHPNEKGQNLMARMIISSLLSHYIPFGDGFN